MRPNSPRASFPHACFTSTLFQTAHNLVTSYTFLQKLILRILISLIHTKHMELVVAAAVVRFKRTQGIIKSYGR